MEAHMLKVYLKRARLMDQSLVAEIALYIKVPAGEKAPDSGKVIDIANASNRFGPDPLGESCSVQQVQERFTLSTDPPLPPDFTYEGFECWIAGRADIDKA